MVYMDGNGDAEGNYTLMARKSGGDEEYGLFPVGTFGHREASSGLPVGTQVHPDKTNVTSEVL